MKNAYAIGSVGRQLMKIGEHIESLAGAVQSIKQSGVDLEEIYAALLIDELEHAQMLTLKLTELITQEGQEIIMENADGEGGSTFFEGDLTTEKDGEDAMKEGGDKK